MLDNWTSYTLRFPSNVRYFLLPLYLSLQWNNIKLAFVILKIPFRLLFNLLKFNLSIENYKTIIVIDTPGLNGGLLCSYFLKHYKINNCLIVSNDKNNINQIVTSAFDYYIINYPLRCDKKYISYKLNTNCLSFKEKVAYYYDILIRSSYFKSAHAILTKTCCKRVFLFNERMTLSSAFCESSKMLGKKIHVIQHGNIVPNYFPSYSHYYWAWGNFYQKFLLKQLNHKRVKVIGLPFEKIDLPPNFSVSPVKNILFCAQKMGSSLTNHEIDLCNKIIYDISEDNPSINFDIKIHPSDNLDSWGNFLSLTNCYVNSVWQKANYQLCCSFYSTCLIDMPFLGIPSFQISHSETVNKVQNLFADCSIHLVTNNKEFKSYINLVNIGKIDLIKLMNQQKKSLSKYYKIL